MSRHVQSPVLRVYCGGPPSPKLPEPDEPPPAPHFGLPGIPRWRRVITKWPKAARNVWRQIADDLTPSRATPRERADAERTAFRWVRAALPKVDLSDDGGANGAASDPSSGRTKRRRKRLAIHRPAGMLSTTGTQSGGIER
jgi:hypothetical protein